jgi:hypothetical protein
VTLADIGIYLALIVFVVARHMIGRPVGPAGKLFALPVIVVVIGWVDATQGSHKPVDVTFAVAGCALSLALGLARGRANRISVRDGARYVQWTWLSLEMFAANLAVVAAGEAVAAAGDSLILSLGLTLLGEAAVVWYRSGRAGQLTSARPGDLIRLRR